MSLTLMLPMYAALTGVVRGPEFLDHNSALTRDLDSHFRYLNGIFLALLACYASCIPAIERMGSRLRLLSLLVITGGLMRALSWGLVGAPSFGHKIGLGIELVIVPLALLWQARLARRFI
ncbi:MAG: DUF4345 domain-containing protein [Sphingomonadales bacterium]|nr:MAG: DUF4345 domain-containing protein [Sphingomonadales bacterium]